LTAHEGGRSVGATEKLSGGSKVELTTPSTLAEATVRLVTEQPLIKICDDMELESGVLEHLEKLVDGGVEILRSTSAAARPPPSAYVDPEMKEIRREEKESKRAKEVLERAAARKEEEEVGLAQGRDAQVAALAMSCSHFVEATIGKFNNF
jgi:hypothetical protein